MAFHGKVAFITGGASGMGKIMATQLAKQNAKVAIIDRNESSLEATASISTNIVPIKCDVTNLEEVKKAVAMVEKDIGPIDRLAHCAAIMPGGLLGESSALEVTKIMHINYFGMVNVALTILPLMKKRNAGDFIVFGSMAGVIPTQKFGGYGATKAATNFFMNVLMMENRDSNIRFQLVCPSAVDTPLIDQAIDKGPAPLKIFRDRGIKIDSPELIIKKVEDSLEKGRKISYPGIASKMNFVYRIAPKFFVKIINIFT